MVSISYTGRQCVIQHLSYNRSLEYLVFWSKCIWILDRDKLDSTSDRHNFRRYGVTPFILYLNMVVKICLTIHLPTGSTGGVLPLGRNGIPAFSNIPAMLDKYPRLPDYSYSLIQQGITANISCTPSPNSPIKVDFGEHIDVTNSPMVDDRALGMPVQNYSIGLQEFAFISLSPVFIHSQDVQELTKW